MVLRPILKRISIRWRIVLPITNAHSPKGVLKLLGESIGGASVCSEEVSGGTMRQEGYGRSGRKREGNKEGEKGGWEEDWVDCQSYGCEGEMDLKMAVY